MRIGITDCLREDKLQLYYDWIRTADSKIEIAKLTPVAGNIETLYDVDGLLLTGGGDIDPEFYGCADLRDKAKGVDARRDSFELEVIQRALDADIPVLGVCRGMQVMNVALGGTLHVDLETDGFRAHSSPGPEVLNHSIAIEPNSLLSGLAGGLEQTVNSYHHQAVFELGKGLVKTAESPDGVIEAAEWSNKEGMSFLMLVQWHPERKTKNKEDFSNNLAKIFLREVEYSVTNKETNTRRR